jgi:FMN phosphatase YigB (HAD superfamily)
MTGIPLNPKPLKAVFFDWEGTLAIWGNYSERFSRLHRLLTASKIECDLDRLKQAVAKVMLDGPNPNSKQGVLAWYETLLSYLEVRTYDSALLDHLRNEYAKQGFILRRGVLRVLRRFNQHQMPIGIITNHSASVRKEIVRAVGPYISSIVISDEVGVDKPDPTIFELAAKSIGMRPIECAYVGDDLTIDAIGAKNNGGFAVGVWLNSAERSPCPFEREGIWIVRTLNQASTLLMG